MLIMSLGGTRGFHLGNSQFGALKMSSSQSNATKLKTRTRVHEMAEKLL